MDLNALLIRFLGTSHQAIIVTYPQDGKALKR